MTPKELIDKLNNENYSLYQYEDEEGTYHEVFFIIKCMEEYNKELIEENKGLKVQMRALQDAVNELTDEKL